MSSIPETPFAPDSPAGPSFDDLGVPDPLVAALRRAGIEHPFPIQQAAIPDALAGRDLLGRGRTGSGKTLAFGIPVLARLAATRQPGRLPSGKPRAMVLVPTRELATQVRASLDPLARSLGLRMTVIYGGVGQNPQVMALRGGLDVVVACPGRLEDLVGQGHCDLSGVSITVLDEADHMADLGFLPAVTRLLDRTPRKGQRLLFSATLDGDVDVIVKRYLTDPVTHSVDPALSPVSAMDHHLFTVSAADKPAVVRELAAGRQRSLLFMRTKHTAKRLARQLTESGIPAVELHGNLSQAARERNLAAFTAGSSRVLVATDIAARGIHVDDIALVVHVDPPAEHKAYLHRSGRTARAGAAGQVVTLALPEQVKDVTALARKAHIRPAMARVSPGSSEISELTGPPAERVAPAPVVLDPPSRPRRSRSGSPAASQPGRGGSRSAGRSSSASGGGNRAANSTSGSGRSRSAGTASAPKSANGRARTASAQGGAARLGSASGSQSARRGGTASGQISGPEGGHRQAPARRSSRERMAPGHQ